MSSNRNPIRPPFKLELRESLIALALAAAFFGLWMIQFFDLPWLLMLTLTLLFAITIWLRRSWGLYGVLIIVFLLRFSTVSSWQRIQLRELTISDFIFPMVLMAFVGASFRFLEVSKFARAFYSSSRSKIGVDGSGEGRKWNLRFPALLSGRWWLVPVAVTFALVLLSVFPYDKSTVREYWITPRGARAIFLGSFLFFLWLICRGLFSLIRRWKMDSERARIQMRSMFAQEYWREQAAVERRRAKMKMKHWQG